MGAQLVMPGRLGSIDLLFSSESVEAIVGRSADHWLVGQDLVLWSYSDEPIVGRSADRWL
jgi:hypothetical protein